MNLGATGAQQTTTAAENRAHDFRSLPRGTLGARMASLGATTGSLRKSWRASLSAPPSDVDVGSPAGAAPDRRTNRPVAAPRTNIGSGGGAGATSLRRRPSLREVVQRAKGQTEELSWSRLPEVVAERVAERLSEAQLVLESLRFALAAWEAAYNAELAPLLALAKRTVSWHDATPVYARRTVASVVEKVKKCSDGALNDMEQMWQKGLTFDGILGVLQKHMDKFEIFITYSNHLNELSSVITGAKVKKSEVAAQAHSELFNLPRVYLPLLHLTVIRKILQEMRGVLEVTNSHLDHFHCKRTLSRITEVLEECYKVLVAAYDSKFVNSLDKKLNECCDGSTRVTFPEVSQKTEASNVNNISKLSSVNKENELKPKSSTIHTISQMENVRTASGSKSLQQIKKSALLSKNTMLCNTFNNTKNGQSSFANEKLQISSTDEGIQTLPKRPKSSFPNHIVNSEPNLTEMNFVKAKLRSVSKSKKTSLNLKAACTEKHTVMNDKRISIVDIPLNEFENSENNAENNKNSLSCTLQENLPLDIEISHETEGCMKSNSNNMGKIQLKHSTSINKIISTENQDLYEENTTNSDHSGSSRSTLYGGSKHDSSSECTLNDYEISNTVENEPTITKGNVFGNAQIVSSKDNTLDNDLYSETSPEYAVYFKNELYCSASGDAQQRDKTQEHCDEATENNYDYVYVMDSHSTSEKCECASCSKQIKFLQQCSYEEKQNLVIRKSVQTINLESPRESITNSECEENIYEDVHYVDMNSQQIGPDSEVTLNQDSDCDQSDIYDDIAIYVKPDVASIRSSSERSRYSSDSGNLEDGSPVYYNSLQSVKTPCSQSYRHGYIEDQDDIHEESDSAIESGSDTGRLPGRKLCRTPSNASMSLQNMVRWKNSQPPTPIRPRKELPISPLQSPFEDVPLYQEYYKTLPTQRKDKEVKQTAEEEKTYIYVQPKEHEYETLDEYLLIRNIVPLPDTFKRRAKRERSDSRRTQWHETEEVLRSGLLDGMSIEQRKLQEAKFEIITSEVSFLKSLNILEKYFINNSEVNSNDVLNEEERRTLFMPIVPVKETSQSFLQDLVKVWEDDICLKNTDLAEVLLKYAKEKFRVYIAYCSRQVAINAMLNHLREKNRKFIELIEKIETKPVCQAFTLQSFLTQPMQRITRFPMLVNAIQRHLPEDDESVDLWHKLLSTLQTVVTECNEAVRNAEKTLADRQERRTKKTLWEKLVHK